jgi:hypothetical protein
MNSIAQLANSAQPTAPRTRNPGITSLVPRISRSSAPPTVHNTTVKVTADKSAWVSPTANSIGASVATRMSSAMRYSGFS